MSERRDLSEHTLKALSLQLYTPAFSPSLPPLSLSSLSLLSLLSLSLSLFCLCSLSPSLYHHVRSLAVVCLVCLVPFSPPPSPARASLASTWRPRAGKMRHWHLQARSSCETCKSGPGCRHHHRCVEYLVLVTVSQAVGCRLRMWVVCCGHVCGCAVSVRSCGHGAFEFRVTVRT